jgi:hypothetical protein
MIIGQIVSRENLELDLPTLVDTRLLIQANSGGGKSWLLRLIAERAKPPLFPNPPDGADATVGLETCGILATGMGCDAVPGGLVRVPVLRGGLW